MKKNIISYRIAHIFLDLVRNILRIWYNYCMLVLLVIIIGLVFVIVFNFHGFKSFFLFLFIWSFLPKNGRFFLLSTFEASASVGHSVLSFLMRLFVEVLCELCWLLLLRERLSLLFFFLCRLCWFLTFRSFLEFLLSWDFFSYLKLCAALRKPEEALFRYYSSLFRYLSFLFEK